MAINHVLQKATARSQHGILNLDYVARGDHFVNFDHAYVKGLADSLAACGITGDFTFFIVRKLRGLRSGRTPLPRLQCIGTDAKLEGSLNLSYQLDSRETHFSVCVRPTHIGSKITAEEAWQMIADANRASRRPINDQETADGSVATLGYNPEAAKNIIEVRKDQPDMKQRLHGILSDKVLVASIISSIKSNISTTDGSIKLRDMLAGLKETIQRSSQFPEGISNQSVGQIVATLGKKRILQHVRGTGKQKFYQLDDRAAEELTTEKPRAQHKVNVAGLKNVSMGVIPDGEKGLFDLLAPDFAKDPIPVTTIEDTILIATNTERAEVNPRSLGTFIGRLARDGYIAPHDPGTRGSKRTYIPGTLWDKPFGKYLKSKQAELPEPEITTDSAPPQPPRAPQGSPVDEVVSNFATLYQNVIELKKIDALREILRVHYERKIEEYFGDKGGLTPAMNVVDSTWRAYHGEGTPPWGKFYDDNIDLGEERLQEILKLAGM